MLVLDGVSKKFRGGNYGVRDLSLSIGGGVLGLLGPNGAGKTTLMQMIATITRPTSGTIRFQDIDAVHAPDAIRRRLGYLPQDFRRLRQPHRHRVPQLLRGPERRA
jgi:ABC-type multidrug transport system ATPase subunit